MSGTSLTAGTLAFHASYAALMTGAEETRVVTRDNDLWCVSYGNPSIAFWFEKLERRECLHSPCPVWLQGLSREGKVRHVRDLRCAHQTWQSQIGLIHRRVLDGLGVLEVAGDHRQVPCLGVAKAGDQRGILVVRGGRVDLDELGNNIVDEAEVVVHGSGPYVPLLESGQFDLGDDAKVIVSTFESLE